VYTVNVDKWCVVEAGILLDDNYEVVPKLILEYGGISKENPRCEIEIKQTSL